MVKAKPGWVIDNQSGANIGLDMVFYPLDKTWSSSLLRIYGRSMSYSDVTDIKTHFKILSLIFKK
jgi:hypothetical protein